jgi:hypothetical protein
VSLARRMPLVDAGEFGFAAGPVGFQGGEGLVDRLPDERLMLQEGRVLVQDRLLKLVGGEAVGPAFVRAVPMPGPPGVVRVHGGAAVRGRPDEAAAAVDTLQEPGEEVIACVRAAK